METARALLKLLVLVVAHFTLGDLFLKQRVILNKPVADSFRKADSILKCCYMCQASTAINCNRFIYNRDNETCQMYDAETSIQIPPADNNQETMENYVRAKDCPVGWTRSLDFLSCYKIENSKMSRSDAETACRSLATTTDLAIIRSQEETDRLVDMANQQGITDGLLWIRLNDIQQEGTFVWYDAFTPFFVAWRDREPNNLDEQDCVTIGANVGTIYYKNWDDRDCSTRYQYICEML